MKSPTKHATLREAIREGDRFTDHDFMNALGIGHLKLKRAEANPSLFTVFELQILATLTGNSLQSLLDLVTAEMQRNPEVAEAVSEKVEEAKSKVVGRKIAPPGLRATFKATAPREVKAKGKEAKTA